MTLRILGWVILLSLAFLRSPAVTLHLFVTGSGTVSPNLNGKTLGSGTYKLTPKPGRGYIFDGWYQDGSKLLEYHPSLKLEVRGGNLVWAWPSEGHPTSYSNIGDTLTAAFVPSPFVGKSGTYQGYLPIGALLRITVTEQ